MDGLHAGSHSAMAHHERLSKRGCIQFVQSCSFNWRLFQARCKNDPLPCTPGIMLHSFLFPTSLVNSGATLIRGEEGGVSWKSSFLDKFANNECVVASALLPTVSTNFDADCWLTQWLHILRV